MESLPESPDWLPHDHPKVRPFIKRGHPNNVQISRVHHSGQDCMILMPTSKQKALDSRNDEDGGGRHGVGRDELQEYSEGNKSGWGGSEGCNG